MQAQKTEKHFDEKQAHYICVTGILVNKKGKYLIAKRAGWEKAFPGRWTVPGGKFKTDDYLSREKDTPFHWYNVFEDVLRRECLEEVGLEISEIGYVTSLVYIRPDNIPTIVVSLYATAEDEKVKLCNALTEHAWISVEEAEEYDLIEGILDEIRMLDQLLKGGKAKRWAHS